MHLSARLTKNIYVFIKMHLEYPHTALIIGQTGCGKTRFVLNLIETKYKGAFEHIVIICPTIMYNEAYENTKWIWTDDEVHVDQLESRDLDDTLGGYFEIFRGDPTLYIIDDCAGSKELLHRNFKKDKKSTICELGFSGRHAKQSVWVLSQKYKHFLKDLRSQAKWLALFYCKDRDSFDEALRENDVIDDDNVRKNVKSILKTKKYHKLILKTDQPVEWYLLDDLDELYKSQ